MNKDSQLTLPPAPNLIGAIRSGFDAITRHIILILFPIILDLVLWAGPRLKLTSLIQSTADRFFTLYSLQDPGMAEFIQPLQAVWSEFAEQFNMLALLRTYPVGITSLLVAQLPINSPVGVLTSWEINTLGSAFLAFILVGLIGICLGTLYFQVVAQAAIIGDISWREAVNQWPWASLQMFFLTALWIVFLLLITIPGSFLVSLVLLSGFSYAQCALIIFAAVIFWMILPFVFSPHGILINRQNFLSSVKISANLIRRTLPTTILFIIAVFLISKGLDILWRAPLETSWLLLIGILGHAFITTALLASSFVYYQDALRWMREIMRARQLKMI
ncbi:MAG: hypothetical protein JSV42_05390 [Chloroflexota bacterium]|nr:MAG: hypothetical protein JSV42_05390 [Chloroflexota bacterium]